VTPELRAKLWAKRCKTKRGAGGRARHISQAIRRITTYPRAQLLLRIADAGITREEAAVACGCDVTSLKSWLHRHTGTTAWPPSDEQITHLRALAEKVWVDCN